MDLRQAFREQFEMIALSEYTIEDLAIRLMVPIEELEAELEWARETNRIVVFSVFRISKLN